jgi:hypothetical protein
VCICKEEGGKLKIPNEGHRLEQVEKFVYLGSLCQKMADVLKTLKEDLPRENSFQ